MGCNCNKTTERPSLAAMATGAVKLAKSEMGIGVAEEDLIASRRKHCEGCDRWNHGKCLECGCYTYAKTRLTREKCPLGYW